MKIYELLSEEDSAYQRGKQAVDKLMSPTKWFSKSPEYEKSHQKVSKLLTPTAWFDKSVDGKPTPQVSTPAKLPGYQIKELLTRTAAGQPLYRQDIQNLKTIYSMVEEKSIKVNDPKAVMDILKSAYSGKALSKEQAAVLSTLSQRF